MFGILEKAIGIVSPSWALRRAYARNTLEAIDKLIGTSGGYDAAKYNRLTMASRANQEHENSIPRAQFQTLRWSSWNAYRNNPYARKIVRSLESTVVGNGLMPRCQAINPDGSPNNEFRQRVDKVWKLVCNELDYLGRPGAGGQHFSGLQRSCLRSVILSGESLCRFRDLQPADMQAAGLALPLQLQLIHAERLDEQAQGDNIFAGIQLDNDGRRVAYHILNAHPSDPNYDATIGVAKIPAGEMQHIYLAEEIDQIRGTPWFSATLLRMLDTSKYESYELDAARMAACVVLGYRRSAGQAQFGLDASSELDLSDTDGNKITNIQPGMFVDLGTSGELSGFNPQRPNSGAVEFITHLIHTIANSVPGVKGSMLTADFRRASYSSERAADNSTWPEIESLQEWFARSFCDPVYARVIDAAVMRGLFEDILSVEEYLARRDDFLAVDWQGPVNRSINPKEDAVAATNRILNGTSSPQREAALAGRDALLIQREMREYLDNGAALGISEDRIWAMLGVTAGGGGGEPNGDAVEKDEEASDAEAEAEGADEAEAA